MNAKSYEGVKKMLLKEGANLTEEESEGLKWIVSHTKTVKIAFGFENDEWVRCKLEPEYNELA